MTDGDGLEGYWQGEFVLREPVEEEPQPALPTDRLAPPEITVRGRNLAALLAHVYRALTS